MGAPTSDTEIWIRPPKHGELCPRSGLSHSVFFSVLKRAGRAVRTASLAPPGKERGVRVVYWPDLKAWLLNLAEQQQAGPQSSEAQR